MSEAATEARRAHWSVWQIIDDMDRRLEESGGEVTPDIDALEALSAEEARYALAQWIAALKEYRGQAEQANAMYQHYRELQKKKLALAAKCKERIGELLVLLDARKCSTPYGTAYFQAGKPSVEVDPEAHDRLVAMMLADVEVKPDKKLIGEQLRKGNPIPGCTLVTGEEVLVVK
jgi:hypothetical protein